MMRIGLIPLDERPANTRDPALIAAAAGVTLVLPPSHLLSRQRQPADCAGLAAWLEGVASTLDGVVVACEQLSYGGLIAARISDEPAETVIQRLAVARRLRQRFPRLTIYGFSVITRVSNANDAVEEPLYWATYGEAIYRWSQALDQVQQGKVSVKLLAEAQQQVPADLRHNVLRRRLRNHLFNLAALHLLNDGVFDLLVLSSDDTSPFGLPSREKRWLDSWAGLLPACERLLMYPGADEVGSVLVMRMALARAGLQPVVTVQYAPAADRHNVAAFEDGPVTLTVERQLAAAGCRLAAAAEEADLWLGVNAPVARRAEWNPIDGPREQQIRYSAVRELVWQAVAAMRAGQTVAFADVAYPNGADPLLIGLMAAQLELPKLVAYGGWNTAGNTIGGVIAQACAGLLGGEQHRIAQERLLLHRLVEDYGYQHLARRELRQWLQAAYGQPELTAELIPLAAARVEQSLNNTIATLPGFASRWQLLPGSVTFPWQRTFEVDFTLQYCAEEGR